MTTGPVETEVIADIEALGDLDGMDPTLAATAYRLAKALDDPETDDKSLPPIAKELRATMVQLFSNHAHSGADEIDLGLST
jgi:hypothetical protein